MKTKMIYLSFFLIITLFNCQKKDTNDLIIGKWKWIKTIIPYGNQETNPQSTGISRSLEFLPNEILKEYRNDTLVNTSSFVIETSSSGQLLLKSSIITSRFSIQKDSLIFNEAYVDGPIIWYAKIKK